MLCRPHLADRQLHHRHFYHRNFHFSVFIRNHQFQSGHGRRRNLAGNGYRRHSYGGTGINSVALTGIAQIVAGTWSASSTLSTAFGGTGWNSIQANSVLLGNGPGRLSTTTAGTDGFHSGFGRRRPDLGGHLYLIHHYRHFGRGQRRHRPNFFRPRLAQFGRDDIVGKHQPDS